jgi:hypothetical protein
VGVKKEGSHVPPKGRTEAIPTQVTKTTGKSGLVIFEMHTRHSSRVGFGVQTQVGDRNLGPEH